MSAYALVRLRTITTAIKSALQLADCLYCSKATHWKRLRRRRQSHFSPPPVIFNVQVDLVTSYFTKGSHILSGDWLRWLGSCEFSRRNADWARRHVGDLCQWSVASKSESWTFTSFFSALHNVNKSIFYADRLREKRIDFRSSLRFFLILVRISCPFYAYIIIRLRNQCMQDIFNR